MQSKHVFSGPDGIKRFNSPDEHAYIPLVELSPALVPEKELGVRIFAKMMNMLPLGNVKSLPALNMLLDRDKTHPLDEVDTMVESSSGNTVFSLTILGRLFGIESTKAFVSNEVTLSKLKLLQLAGTQIEVGIEPICPSPGDPDSGVSKAKSEGEQIGKWNPGQYHNRANPGAHERWTAPQIWEQTDGKISLFCAGLGTTGTFVGCSKYLKSKSSSIRTIGVVRAPNNPVPGVRTSSLLREIEFDWESLLDEQVAIGTEEAFRVSLNLCRGGLLVGPSAGFALAGLQRAIAALNSRGELDQYRDENGEVIAVFIAPDSPLPYIDEYFQFLAPSLFPEIKNAHLLRGQETSGSPSNRLPDKTSEGFSLEPEEAHDILYGTTIDATTRMIEKGENLPLSDSTVLLDVRRLSDFSDHHLPSSVQIDYPKLLRVVDERTHTLLGLRVVVVCAQGIKTAPIVAKLREQGVEAYNLKGGTLEWSRRRLPRCKSASCISYGASRE